MLERRDKAVQQFVELGGDVLIERTTSNGALNLEPHPALKVINDLNKDALAYWRDLGLTPAGLKRINESAVSDGLDQPSLAAVLKDIGI